MTVETGTYINSLDANNPASGDSVSEGDDHVRFLKSTIKATFPNISAAVTPTATELNYVAGVTSAIQTQLSGKVAWTSAAGSGTINLSEARIQTYSHTGSGTINLPTSGSIGDVVLIAKSAGTIAGKINGTSSSSYSVTTQSAHLFINVNSSTPDWYGGQVAP